MSQNDIRYEVPTEATEAREALEDRYFRLMGRTLARVLALIKDADARELAAAHLTVLQDGIATIRRDETALSDSVIQRAYTAGRTQGCEEVGRQLGMLPSGPIETPETRH